MGIQSLVHLVFPPQCVSCGTLMSEPFALCGSCWRQTPFISGLVCDLCGVPLPGEASKSGADLCDDCMKVARPWRCGRAAVAYRDNARRLILALKHGDRLDLVRPAARWMAAVAEPCLSHDSVIVPVPVHPTRLLRRRYNQAAALALALSRELERPCDPRLLRRHRRTGYQDGMNRDGRFLNVADSIGPSKHAMERLEGRGVLLIDDVMTSGATLAASTEAALGAGAREVSVLVLARVGKED